VKQALNSGIPALELNRLIIGGSKQETFMKKKTVDCFYDKLLKFRNETSLLVRIKLNFLELISEFHLGFYLLIN